MQGIENLCRFWISSLLIRSLQSGVGRRVAVQKQFWMRAGNSRRAFRIGSRGVGASSSVRLRIAEPEPGPRPHRRAGGPVVMILEGSKSYWSRGRCTRGSSVRRIETEGTRSSCGTEIPQSGKRAFRKKCALCPRRWRRYEAAGQFEARWRWMLEARRVPLLDEQAVDDDFMVWFLRLSMTGSSSSW